ncbi:MAG: entericidin EcnAB [Campylobacterota bacterium]|nr:entericidin EcnAB [Campylobacterota bacterium]
MKKFLMLAMFVVISMVSTGCATWDGVKQDSQEGWDATKGAIHEATQ